MDFKRYLYLLLPASLMLLSSCLGDNDDEYQQYEEWYTRNMQYLTDAEEEKLPSGESRYVKVVPAWDPEVSVLMQWHRRNQGPSRLKPLDNSTVNMTYLLTNIDGDTLDSSFSRTDSVFQSKPSGLITGFWTALTNMEEGDSVTAVVPYWSGYGINGSGAIKPFSTLVFQIKLKKIVAYDKEPWRP